MKLMTIILLLILFSSFVVGYDNIIEFDENENIIITTTVYNNTGNPCKECTCNITVYNPSPNESIIYVSTLMNGTGSGVYVSNLTKIQNFTANKDIYPMIIVCNDSRGYMGGDDREGIKVSVTLFDYTAGALILLGIGLALMFGSLRMNDELWSIKRLMFFSSFGFYLSASIFGFLFMKNSPNSAGFETTFETVIILFSFIIMAIIYLFVKHRLIKAVEIMKK